MNRRTTSYLVISILIAVTAFILPSSTDARGRRILIDFGDWIDATGLDLVGDQNSATISTDPTNSVGPPLPFTLKIGQRTYDRIWVNENGFISLGELDDIAAAPIAYQAGLQSVTELTGPIIAPYYADMETQVPTPSCDQNTECDIAYSVIDITGTPDPGNGYVRAFRVTWGAEDEPPPPPNDFPVPGVRQASGGPELVRAQLRIIDRSDTTGTSGDFDIEFNYDGIKWEDSPSLVGINVDGVIIDFGDFYTSFLDSALGNTDICDAGNNVEPDPVPFPAFDTSSPLSCNWTTIKFRDGAAELKSYTSDIEVSLVGPATAFNTTEDFQVTATITNLGPSDATGVTVDLALPTGTALVSGNGCSSNENGATCVVGNVSESGPTPINVILNTTSDSLDTYTATAAADQYDPMSGNNGAPINIDANPSADLSLNCAASGSATINNNASVTCTVQNNGPQTANNIIVSATAPTGLSVTQSGSCNLVGNNVECSAASVSSGSSLAFTVTGTSGSVQNFTISPTVIADENDPVSANNSDSFVLMFSGSGGGSSNQSSGGGGRISYPIILLLAAIIGLRLRHPRTAKSNSLN